MNTHDPRHGHPHEDGLDLGRALNEQVKNMNDAPLGMRDIQGRAGAVRRRRALIVGAGIAAAAAIAVPLALVAGNNVQRSDNPPVATQRPTATASASPTPSEPTPTLGDGKQQDWTLAGLSQGAAPSVPYFEGGTAHLPDGTNVEIDAAQATQLGRLSDGRWLLAVYDDQSSSTTLRARSADGTLAAEYPFEGTFAVSPSGGTVVWQRPDRAVLALQAGDDAPTKVGQLPAGRSAVRAVRGSDCATDCVISGSTSGKYGLLQNAWEMTPDGSTQEIGHGLIGVADTTEGPKVIGLTSVDERAPGSCSALVDLSVADAVWETCDNSLDQFSPDGSFVLASDAYHDGWGNGEVAIYDAASGQRVLDLVVQGGQNFAGYQGFVWEDDTHVLVVTYFEGAWAVVRIGVDGSMEYAAPPVKSRDDLAATYRLLTPW